MRRNTFNWIFKRRFINKSKQIPIIVCPFLFPACIYTPISFNWIPFRLWNIKQSHLTRLSNRGWCSIYEFLWNGIFYSWEVLYSNATFLLLVWWKSIWSFIKRMACGNELCSVDPFWLICHVRQQSLQAGHLLLIRLRFIVSITFFCRFKSHNV